MRRGLERARRTRRLALTAALVGGLISGTALPASAEGPASGGQNGGTPQSTKTTPTGDGVSSPELTWTQTLTDHRQVGGDEYEPVFDSEGHILYQGVNSAPDPNEQVLVAIDRETGDVDWELAGVSAGCGVAASDDGMIYGTTAATGVDQLLAIDAVTGQVVDSFTPQLHGDEGMNPCRESLRLADDGTLINLNSFDFDMHMQAFDTNGGLSLKWERHYHIEHTGGADAESTSWSARPVISADGSAVYHCRQELEEERPDSASDRTWFEKIDLATGDLVAEVAIHENAPCKTRGVVAFDGGAIVGAAGNAAEYKMLRIDDHGDSLSIAWETVFSRDEDVDESGFVNYPSDSLALAGDDTIVTRGAGGGIYIGVDVDTGQVEWQYRSEGFNNGYDNHSADRFGNVYVTNHDAALESFSSNGTRRFAVTGTDLYGGTDIISVKAILVGPDGGVFVRGRADGNHSAFFRVDDGPTRRIAGAGRFDTAAQLALQTFGPTVDTVYLATGMDYPDALAVGPLAASDGAPVLLGTATTLPDATADALASLQPDNVIAIGGTAAIGDTVLAQAATAAGGATTDRYSGPSRFGTAAAIAHHMPPSDTMYLGTGMDYPDSLAGGPATDGGPIVLTTRDTLPQETIAILGDRQPSRVVALGGAGAVSDAVLAQAAAAAGGAATDRLAGPDRWSTSVGIAQQIVDRGDFGGTVYVAVGTNYPDAVAAASAAEANGAPIVLTATDVLPDAVRTWLSSVGGLDDIVILGGATAVSPAVEAELAALVG